MDRVIEYILGLCLIYCAFTDFKDRVIKNYITFPLMLLGIVHNTIQNGIGGLLNSLVAMCAIGAISLLFAAVDGLGIGDVKLYIGIAAIKGLMFGLYTILISCVLSIIGFFIQKPDKIKTFFSNLKNMGLMIYLTRRLPKPTTEEKKEAIPFALYILLAVFLLVLGGM